MRRTSDVLRAHADAMCAYTPDPAEVAILFQRDTYFYDWATKQFHDWWEKQPFRAADRNLAWARSLERLNVAYRFLDDRHLSEAKPGLKLMIVPWAAGLDDAAARWLLDFARNGGVVFVEGAAGEIGADTYFRYPNERPLTKDLGLAAALHRLCLCDKRAIPSGVLGNDEPLTILPDEIEVSFQPGQRHVIALPPDNMALLANVPVGSGRVLCLGTLVGDRMNREAPAELRRFVECLLVLAGVARPVRASGDQGGFCSATLGGATARLLIVTNHGTAQRVTLTLAAGRVPAAKPAEWFGHDFSATTSNGAHVLTVPMEAYDFAAFEWRHP
jgi:hypothetical protein